MVLFPKRRMLTPFINVSLAPSDHALHMSELKFSQLAEEASTGRLGSLRQKEVLQDLQQYADGEGGWDVLCKALSHHGANVRFHAARTLREKIRYHW